MSTSTTLSQRIIGSDALAQAPAALARTIPSVSLLAVYDKATWAAAGEAVTNHLGSSFQMKVHTLERNPKPLLKTAEEISNAAASCDAILAVGSGTINDLCKYAAATSGKPYAVIATAASMNGYTASNASLIENGIKRSYAAAPPKLVIADTTILNAAPRRMLKAGLGDTLCRSTVEADMLLTHWLFDAAYPKEFFDRMREHEAALVTAAGAISNGDGRMTERLMEALLDAGDAMTTYGSSAPASQGEHMIAHTIEMKYGSEYPHMLHGEMIAITSLTMGQLQQRMMRDVPQVSAIVREEATFQRNFGKASGAELHALYQKKILSEPQVTEINARLTKNWPELKEALSAIIVPTGTIERALIQMGATTKPAGLNISEEHYRFACNHAYLVRDRFTFLDLAAMNHKRVI